MTTKTINGYCWYCVQSHNPALKTKEPCSCECHNPKITGSGWGKLTPGQKLETPDQFYDGRIILTYSKRFNAKNVCVVTSGFLDRNDDRAYLLFLDPEDTTQKRRGDDQRFVLWDFMLKSDRDVYYSVKEK